MGTSAETGQEIAPIPETLDGLRGRESDVLRELADLPSVMAAMAGLHQVIVLQGNGLTREEKESIGAGVTASHSQSGKPHDTRLLAFSEKLSRYGPCISIGDIDALQNAGISEAAILEAIALVAWGNILDTIAEAFLPGKNGKSPVQTSEQASTSLPEWNTSPGPFLRKEASLSEDHIAKLRPQYGFIPKLLITQGQWPNLIEAETKALECVVFSEEHLTRAQKEGILLAVSAANLNAYGVALHGQMLTVLGTSSEDCKAILEDLSTSSFTAGEKILLGKIPLLARHRRAGGAVFDPRELENNGFTRDQILEAVATASLGNFFNTLQFGLGVPPDFPPIRVFSEKDLYLNEVDLRPTSDVGMVPDPDAELVARVKAGETDVFEELIRRHSRRVFGTLHGILGNYEEARDATQDVFVKAFEHLVRFEGRAKFSTWVTSIAVNTGTELLRRCRPNVPLDEAADEDFRPRQVQSWAKDPEAIFATGQINTLVREAVLRLPQKYRVAVILRDINQVSTEDAAATLGLSVPALKARVLRGRLMLRESLAAHFTRRDTQDA